MRQDALESPWDRLVAGLVLGSEAFTRRLLQRARGDAREMTALSKLVSRVSNRKERTGWLQSWLPPARFFLVSRSSITRGRNAAGANDGLPKPEKNLGMPKETRENGLIWKVPAVQAELL